MCLELHLYDKDFFTVFNFLDMKGFCKRFESLMSSPTSGINRKLNEKFNSAFRNSENKSLN